MLELFNQAFTNLLKGVENASVFIGKLIKSEIAELKNTITTHLYKVEVQNPTEKVEVKGTVVVANQVKVEKNLKELLTKLQEIKKSIPSQMNVRVLNPPKEVSFPRSFEVSNFPDKIKVLHLEDVIKEIENVVSAIKSLDIKPQVKVEVPKIPAPVVNVPEQKPPVVNVTKENIDLQPLVDLIKFWQSLTNSAKKYISVRLSDGQQFYKALDKIVESTSNVSFPFVNPEGDAVRAVVNRFGELMITTSETWDTNHIDRSSPNITYYGEESVDGKWRIRKVETTNYIETYTYATSSNNSTITDYLTAWDNRSSLVYSRIGEI